MYIAYIEEVNIYMKDRQKQCALWEGHYNCKVCRETAKQIGIHVQWTRFFAPKMLTYFKDSVLIFVLYFLLPQICHFFSHFHTVFCQAFSTCSTIDFVFELRGLPFVT